MNLFARDGDLVNPYSLAVLFLCITFLLGFLERYFLVISLGWLLYLSYMYLKLLVISRRVKIKRMVSTSGREKDIFEIIYRLDNRSSFHIIDFALLDKFEGIEEGKIEISNEDLWSRASRKKIKKQFIFNNGMGEKKFGPLKLQLWDPLGIFIFRIEFNYKESILVYPRIAHFKNQWAKHNDESVRFGKFEINNKGDTTNFLGVEEYREGDPLRKINWKLSMKGEKIYVNIFEKLVDTKLNVYFNGDFNAHFGTGAKSSFEYTKDIVLTIAQEEMSKGSEFRLITDEKAYFMGSGQDYYHFLEKSICSQLLTKVTKRDKLEYLLSSLYEERGASFIYISPIHNQSYLNDDLKALGALATQGISIIVILIEGVNFYYPSLSRESKISLSGHEKGLLKIKENFLNNLRKTNIFVHCVKIDNSSFDDEMKTTLKAHQFYMAVYD